MKTAVELAMTGNYVRFPVEDMSNYDSTKHNLGPVFFKGSDVWTGVGKEFIGPAPIQVARPMENSCAFASGIPYAMKINEDRFAVVVAEIATANVLRRFGLYIYDSGDNTFTYQGAISYTFPSTAVIRGIRLQRSLHTTGQASCSGTAVTGSGTDWLTRRVNAGSRIGFGSKDPNLITTWYDLSATAISSNTDITLLTTAGTKALADYVIEDYSLLIHSTNNTTTDGGLRVIKGLSLSSACWSTTATATVIATAAAVDNVRACYWLKDASTVTNLIGAGLGVEAVSSDNLTQYVYCLDATSASTVKIFKFNVKAPLTVASGISTSAFQYVTGVQTIVGTTSQNHNCRIATLKHGAGINVPSLYFTTTTRLYRCVLTDIIAASTTFLQDAMIEIPPGGANTLPATGAMSTLEIFDSLDRIAWISSCATAFRSYLTQYRTDSSQMDHLWLGDTKLVHGSTADGTAYPYPNTSSTLMGSWGEGGMVFLIRQGTTALLNQMYSVPYAAHWGYQNTAPYNVYITPSISTPGCTKYSRLSMNECQQLGNENLGVSPEGYKVYYRTAGITDNSGAWQPLGIDYDLSGITAASAIQFKFEFKILSNTCVPGRIFGLSIIYDTSEALPSNFEWNLADSSNSDGTVGYDQLTLVGTTIAFQIDYYRSDTQANVLTQTSASTTNGTFQYWGGSSWVAGVGTDTVGLRRRFVPTAGLPSGTNVYAKIQLI